jgi:hypothetical protein
VNASEPKVIKVLPKVKLYFRFYGESFDPDEITARLGVEPTEQFRPGDPITKDGRGKRRKDGWWIKVGPQRTLEIDDLLQELREKVVVDSAIVRQLCQELNINLVILCGVGMGSSEDLPITYFPPDFVGWAAEMGAAINVDIVL